MHVYTEPYLYVKIVFISEHHTIVKCPVSVRPFVCLSQETDVIKYECTFIDNIHINIHSHIRYAIVLVYCLDENLEFRSGLEMLQSPGAGLHVG